MYEQAFSIKQGNEYPKALSDNYAMRIIYNRAYYQDQDCLVAVVGETGTGKTNFSVSASEILSIKPRSTIPRFRAYNPKKIGNIVDYKNFKVTGENFEHLVPDLCYGTKQLQNFWNRMNHLTEKDMTLSYGRPAIVEEAQNIINSRTYYGQSNMNTLRNLLTGRVFQNIYFLTYPSFNDIDKQIRKILHFRVDMLEPERKEGYFLFKFKKLVDVEKNEYGNYIRDTNYAIDDFFNIPKKENTGTPIRPASDELYTLAKLKGRFWKMAVRSGKIDEKTGDYREKKIDAVSPKVERTKKIYDWATANYDRRKEFISKKTGDYAPLRVASAMGHLSYSYGLIAIEEWKRLESVSGNAV